MNLGAKCLVSTSGYSFPDWVGPFYPPDTRRQEMFAQYVRQFRTVELNYTFYRMPAAKTLERGKGRVRLALRAGSGILKVEADRRAVARDLHRRGGCGDPPRRDTAAREDPREKWPC